VVHRCGKWVGDWGQVERGGSKSENVYRGGEGPRTATHAPAF